MAGFTSGGAIEVRSDGAADNGGYYNSNIAGAGTDYTQQKDPVCSGSDGDCNNSTTFTTNGSTPFTSAMVGNAIHISGTGFTTGWYEIRTYNSTSSVVLNANPTSAGGHPTTGSYKVGGAVTVLDAPLCTTVSTNCIAHVKSGSYTWGAITVNASNPSGLGGIQGYKTSRGDNPTGTDRPDITITGAMTVGNYSRLKDVYIHGSPAADLITGGTANAFINCKIAQTAASTRTALYATADSASIALGCEVICTNGYAINSINLCVNCNAHDSVHGYWMNNPMICVNCVADTCTTAGFKAAGTGYFNNCINCAAYNCGTQFDGATNGGYFNVINCIGKTCTASMTGTVTYRQILANSVLDRASTNVNMLFNNTTADPLMTDPANQDFTLQASSPALNAGWTIGPNVGAVGAYKLNAGVDQNDHVAAATGGAFTFAG